MKMHFHTSYSSRRAEHYLFGGLSSVLDKVRRIWIGLGSALRIFSMVSIPIAILSALTNMFSMKATFSDTDN